MAEDVPGTAAPAKPRRRRHRLLVLVALVALAALALLIVWRRHGASRGPARPPQPAVAVVAATAERGDLPVYLETIGTVTALNTVALASLVNGTVEAAHYKEGQLVRRGTPLVDIDPRPFQAALLQAEGILARDEHVLVQARVNLARFRAAWARNAIAKQQLDDQEQLVRQAEGSVLSDRGAVEAARVNLSYCHLTSPIDGRVGLQLVDPGNYVVANSPTPLVVVAQIEPISVIFPVSEDDLGRLVAQPDHGRGLTVTALDRTRKRELANGTLTAIDNQIDTTTGTVRVRAEFDNAGRELFPNQFVNTRVLVETLRGVVMVPSAAIQRDGQKAFVYAVDSGRAHVVPVVPGAASGDRTQVDGIDAGTRVATSSFEKLREGVPVAIEDGRAATR